MNKTIFFSAIFGTAFLQACSNDEQAAAPATEPVVISEVEEVAARSDIAENCAAGEDVTYLCGPVNAEDILQVGDSPWLIVSGMNGDLSGQGNNGTIHLVNHESRDWSVLFPGNNPVLELNATRFSACPGPLDTGKFSAHGLALRQQGGNPDIYNLYMTSHGAREAIEAFEVNVSGTRPVIKWTGCVPIPGTSWTNSVAILEDGGFFATQFMDNALHGIENVTNGEVTGHVFEWHPGGEVLVVPGTELAGPNGILVSEDESTLYVAAFGGHKVMRYDLGDSPISPTEIAIGMMPDNLRWTDSGTILTAGGIWQEGCEGTECGGVAVIEIDPATMTARTVWETEALNSMAHPSVATQVGEEIWVGSYMGDRVAIVPVQDQ